MKSSFFSICMKLAGVNSTHTNCFINFISGQKATTKNSWNKKKKYSRTYGRSANTLTFFLSSWMINNDVWRFRDLTDFPDVFASILIKFIYMTCFLWCYIQVIFKNFETVDISSIQFDHSVYVISIQLTWNYMWCFRVHPVQFSNDPIHWKKGWIRCMGFINNCFSVGSTI